MSGTVLKWGGAHRFSLSVAVARSLLLSLCLSLLFSCSLALPLFLFSSVGLSRAHLLSRFRFCCFPSMNTHQAYADSTKKDKKRRKPQVEGKKKKKGNLVTDKEHNMRIFKSLLKGLD